MKRDKIKIAIPNDTDGITVDMYQEYLQLLEEIEQIDKHRASVYYKLSVASIFSGIDKDVLVANLTAKGLEKLSKASLDLLNEMSEESKRIDLRFEHKGIHFAMLPSLEEMSTAEYVDLTSWYADVKHQRKVAAILFRPVIAKVNNKKLKRVQYEIEPYEGSDKYADIMGDAPAKYLLGASFFLTNLYLELVSYSLNSLDKEEIKSKGVDIDKLQRNLLAISGAGISPFTLSLEKTF